MSKIKYFVVLENVYSIGNPQLLGDASNLFHFILGQIEIPAFPVLLQSSNAGCLRIHAHPTLQVIFYGHLSRSLTMFGTYLVYDLIFEQVQLPSVAISPAQRCMSHYVDAIFLCSFDQALLGQVGMGFDLQDNWLYLT